MPQQGLETYETFYRGLDPQLGRFNSIDPSAESYYGESPYVSMGNDPVLNADPMGDDYWSTSDPDQIASFMNAIGSQASQYDFSGWKHSTDQYDADGKMSYDDELMKLYYSYTKLLMMRWSCTEGLGITK